MTVDDRQLGELIVQSKDLQSGALRASREALPELGDLAAERADRRPSPEQLAQLEDGRRGIIRNLGLGGGAAAGKALVGGGIGAALLALLARPAAADSNLDVQILQTASSLERLAVGTYAAALTLPFIKDGNKVVVAFAEETMKQHDEHRKAFQAQTTALGGKVQDQPNPKYKAIVDAAVPTLKTPLDVVKLAAVLEEVATDTYLMDLALFEDTRSKEIMGSVMGVEAQHLAVLRAVGALLQANAPQFIAIPTDLANLPAAAGSVAFPKPFEEATADGVADPSTGAVK